MDTEPNASWYHGKMTRDDAERLLMKKLPGTFLVRFSRSTNGYSCTLSYRNEDKCIHTFIYTTDSGYTFLQRTYRSSLNDLIEYHKDQPITLKGKRISFKLLYPCERLDTLFGRLSRQIPSQYFYEIFLGLGLDHDVIRQTQKDHIGDVTKQKLCLLLKWKQLTRTKDVEGILAELKEFNLEFNVEELYTVNTVWRKDLLDCVTTDQLSSVDDKDLRNIFHTASFKYFDLGIELGFHEKDIKNYEQDNKDRLAVTTLIIREWIQRFGPWATWAAIGDAMFEVGADVEFIQIKYQTDPIK